MPWCARPRERYSLRAKLSPLPSSSFLAVLLVSLVGLGLFVDFLRFGPLFNDARLRRLLLIVFAPTMLFHFLCHPSPPRSQANHPVLVGYGIRRLRVQTAQLSISDSAIVLLLSPLERSYAYLWPVD